MTFEKLIKNKFINPIDAQDTMFDVRNFSVGHPFKDDDDISMRPNELDKYAWQEENARCYPLRVYISHLANNERYIRKGSFWCSYLQGFRGKGRDKPHR